MGVRTTNFARSIWLVGVSLLAAALTVIVAARIHTLHAPADPIQFIERYTGYAIGACIQQVLLQGFFLPRLLRLTRSPGYAALAAAALFSLAHLPNPILTVITIFWGLVSCLFFLRYRNLYTLVVAHTILGITVAISIPGPVIRNMRVGLGYVTYPTDHLHHRSH
jgi:membrane protease YdiL (CAAX protease family)